MVKKILVGLGLAVLAAIGLAWAVAPVLYPAENPAGRHTGVILSERGDALLRRACFDCHSNETVWPWYANTPLVGLLVRRDVHEGRREFNFSDWNTMAPRRLQRKAKESVEQLDKGEMPPWFYLPPHPEARLSAEEVATLRASFTALAGTTGAGGSGEDGRRSEQRERREGREGKERR